MLNDKDFQDQELERPRRRGSADTGPQTRPSQAAGLDGALPGCPPGPEEGSLVKPLPASVGEDPRATEETLSSRKLLRVQSICVLQN